MSRRRILAGAGMAGMVPVLGRRRKPQPVQQGMWEQESCPGCGLDVMFLPGQRRNRCAWCGRRVRHAVE